MAGKHRPTKAVYWRRRLGVLGALALVVVVAVSLLSGSGNPHPQATAHGNDGPAAGTAGTTTGTSVSSRPVDPAMFSPGSCTAFEPTAGDRHLTVFLDAGHGGIDPGAIGVTRTGKTIHEADETLPVELDATALLRAQGYRVVDSRTSATTVARLSSADLDGNILTVQGSHDDVAARDVCANMAHADILIGIYFDAGSSQSNAGSVTAYNSLRPFAAANKRLATVVQTDVVAAMNSHGWDIPNVGIMTDESLGGPPLNAAAAAYGHLLLLGPAMPGYFSTPSQMPGALIEPLFITDPFEGSLADSAAGQQAIAQGLDQAVQMYFAAPSQPGATSGP